MYQLLYQKRALKTLNKLPIKTARLIREKLEQLALDPHALNRNVTKLQDQDAYRLRVGDWRVVYELFDDELIISAVKIGSRGDIYK